MQRRLEFQGLSVIQIRQRGTYWIPVFTGMTDSYEVSGDTIIERPWLEFSLD